MSLLSAWFLAGLTLDAWAHSNLTDLETFFTPWHAVFYSGFAATAAWAVAMVWRNIPQARSGAIPVGYGWTVVALAVFGLSGIADGVWHTIWGIETTINILFSPSHLANALKYRAEWIVDGFSTERQAAAMLAAKLIISNIAQLVPVFFLARRWQTTVLDSERRVVAHRRAVRRRNRGAQPEHTPDIHGRGAGDRSTCVVVTPNSQPAQCVLAVRRERGISYLGPLRRRRVDRRG